MDIKDWLQKMLIKFGKERPIAQEYMISGKVIGGTWTKKQVDAIKSFVEFCIENAS